MELSCQDNCEMDINNLIHGEVMFWTSDVVQVWEWFDKYVRTITGEEAYKTMFAFRAILDRNEINFLSPNEGHVLTHTSTPREPSQTEIYGLIKHIFKCKVIR
jgi:hypothetical protein